MNRGRARRAGVAGAWFAAALLQACGASPRPVVELPPRAAGDGAMAAEAVAPTPRAIARSSRHAPIVVVGEGPYAEHLLQQARARLPDGWRGKVRVPPDCSSTECIHWSAASADGLQRIEQWPVLVSRLRGPPGIEDRHIGLDLLRVRAGDIAREHYPDATAMHGAHLELGDGSPSPRSYTLSLRREAPGEATRIEIALELAVFDAPVFDEQMRAGPHPDMDHPAWTTVRVRSAPWEVFDAYALQQVESALVVLPDGWDDGRASCESERMMICHQQMIGAQELCQRLQCTRVPGGWTLHDPDPAHPGPRSPVDAIRE